MNFHEFILSAEAHLLERGWYRQSHNGAWPTFCQRGRQAIPLPAAIVEDLTSSCAFQPRVESYLLTHGWQRTKATVVLGLPYFVRGKARQLTSAMLEQLKQHRLDRNTPAKELRAVHSVGRGSEPPQT